MQSNAGHKKGVLYNGRTLWLEDVSLIELKSVLGSFGTGKVSDVRLRLPNGKTYGVFSHAYISF